MAMYANIPETGPAIIGQTITDNQLYVANKSECDSDYDNFKTEVNKLHRKSTVINIYFRKHGLIPHAFIF